MEDEMALTQETAVYSYSYSLEFCSTVERIRARIAPFRFHLAAKAIANELNLKPTDRILEIGSGLGLLGKEIRKIAGNTSTYFGIDLIFDSAKKSKEAVLPVQANAIALPFGDSIFDEVVSTDVLEHIKEVKTAIKEIFRVLKPKGKAFIVIADPSEARFLKVKNHTKRTEEKSDINWWEKLFKENGFEVLSEASEKYRRHDWRKIFNLPFLVKLKDKPLFACAFNPVCRPGVYILKKPIIKPLNS